jgi:hypothetical protein
MRSRSDKFPFIVIGVLVAIALVAIPVAYVARRNQLENPGSTDGVLWRQIIVFKDAMWPALDAVRFSGPDTVRAAVAQGSLLGGPHWDGTSDPEALGLADGGIVTYDYAETPFSVAVLISSGPRDAEGDIDGDYPYFGANAWHTCATLTFKVYGGPPDEAQQAESSISLEDRACDPELVATLEPGSELHPIGDFSG